MLNFDHKERLNLVELDFAVIISPNYLILFNFSNSGDI